MKRILTKTVALLLASPVLFSSPSIAQQREKKERIVIEQKGGKKDKMIIEIDGDKVKVNGQPVEKGDSNIVIYRYEGSGDMFRAPKSPKIKVLPYGPMEPHGGWDFQFRQYGQQMREYGDQMRRKSGQMRIKMKDMKERLKNTPFLGVQTEDHEKGALITRVEKGSAAEKAGLKEGDIITKVNDTEIENPNKLSQAIRNQKPGDEVKISYIRDKKNKSTKAELGNIKLPEDVDFNVEIPDLPELPPLPPMPEFKFDKDLQFEYLHPWNPDGMNGDLQWFHNRPRLGATIQDTEEGNGVKIIEVDEGSAAAKGGLLKDDIVTEINGKKIVSVRDAREALRDAGEKNTWNIQVLRNGKPATIEIKIPKELKKADL